MPALVYLRQGGVKNFEYLTPKKEKYNDRKAIYYDDYTKKHYLAKVLTFSSDSACQQVRSNFSFALLSDQEVEAFRKAVSEIQSHHTQVHKILGESLVYGKKQRLVLRSGSYGWEVVRQKMTETLPEKDPIDLEEEMKEHNDEESMIEQPMPVITWKSDFGSFYVTFLEMSENKEEYIKALENYLSQFRTEPLPLLKKEERKRKPVGGGGKNNSNKKSKIEEEPREEGFTHITKIFQYMKMYNEEDCIDCIVKYGESISEDLNCQYDDLIETVRKISSKQLNDIYKNKIIFTE